MKRVMSLAAVVLLIFTMCVSAYAVEARMSGVDVKLTFSDTTANCRTIIENNDGLIKATMTLKQGNTVLRTWSGSGSAFLLLNGTYAATKGVTYTLVASGTIDGKSFTSTATATCK